MRLVRRIEIDRARSTIVDLKHAATSAWRVVFRLNPRPAKPWDEYFEAVAAERSAAGRLKCEHVLRREPRDDTYHFSPPRRFMRRLRRLMFSRHRLSVYVTCDAGAQELSDAIAELSGLVTATNQRYREAEQALTNLAKQEDIAAARLKEAMHQAEKQLKTAIDDLKAPRKVGRVEESREVSGVRLS